MFFWSFESGPVSSLRTFDLSADSINLFFSLLTVSAIFTALAAASFA